MCVYNKRFSNSLSVIISCAIIFYFLFDYILGFDEAVAFSNAIFLLIISAPPNNPVIINPAIKEFLGDCLNTPLPIE
jgi:hypothetical protein